MPKNGKSDRRSSRSPRPHYRREHSPRPRGQGSSNVLGAAASHPSSSGHALQGAQSLDEYIAFLRGMAATQVGNLPPIPRFSGTTDRRRDADDHRRSGRGDRRRSPSTASSRDHRDDRTSGSSREREYRPSNKPSGHGTSSKGQRPGAKQTGTARSNSRIQPGKRKLPQGGTQPQAKPRMGSTQRGQQPGTSQRPTSSSAALSPAEKKSRSVMNVRDARVGMGPSEPLDATIAAMCETSSMIVIPASRYRRRGTVKPDPPRVLPHFPTGWPMGMPCPRRNFCFRPVDKDVVAAATSSTDTTTQPPALDWEDWDWVHYAMFFLRNLCWLQNQQRTAGTLPHLTQFRAAVQVCQDMLVTYHQAHETMPSHAANVRLMHEYQVAKSLGYPHSEQEAEPDEAVLL